MYKAELVVFEGDADTIVRFFVVIPILGAIIGAFVLRVAYSVLKKCLLCARLGF